MSYDIRFAVKVAGHEDLYAVIGEPEFHSPTYNVADIFRACMGWNYQQGEWYKVTDILPYVRKGLDEITRYPQKYKHLEPDNGYGSVATVRKSLFSIIKWFESDFDGLRGSWNADIPLEDIYMRW